MLLFFRPARGGVSAFVRVTAGSCVGNGRPKAMGLDDEITIGIGM